MRSRTPFSTRACTTVSRSGRFPTGIMTFGTDAVKGPIRAPSPAARITAFTGCQPPYRGEEGMGHADALALPHHVAHSITSDSGRDRGRHRAFASQVPKVSEY